MILRTVRTVFAHTALLQPAPGDLILFASSETVDPSRADIETVQSMIDARDEIRDALVHEFGFSDAVILLLAHTRLDERGVTGFMDGRESGSVNTDANLRLENDVPSQR